MTTRVTTIGYQGNANVGDEAILLGLERSLRNTGVHVRAILGGPEAIAAFPSATRVAPRRMLPDRSSVARLRGSDALIVAGGGLINDHWPTLVPRYLAWIILARVLGLRVIWVGSGVGPLRHRVQRALAGLMLRLSTAVAVRDSASAELVARLPFAGRPDVVPDPAFFLDPPRPRTRSGSAFIVRVWSTSIGGPDAFDEALAECAAALPNVTLIYLEATDAPLAEHVGELTSVRTALRIPVVDGSQDPRTTLELLATFEFVVSMRLHGLILAAIAETPCVPISYDPKVRAMAAILGIEEACIDVAEVAPTRVFSARDVVCRPTVQAAIRDHVANLAGRADQVGHWIEEVLVSPPEDARDA